MKLVSYAATQCLQKGGQRLFTLCGKVSWLTLNSCQLQSPVMWEIKMQTGKDPLKACPCLTMSIP